MTNYEVPEYQDVRSFIESRDRDVDNRVVDRKVKMLGKMPKR